MQRPRGARRGGTPEREPALTRPADEPLGVILTGGLGTRLRPLTPGLPKALVPILNRPLVAYGLDLLAAAGLREIVVVVGGADARTGPTALAEAPAGVRVSVAVQP
ncbi:MAG: hypothetical protein FJZ92_13950, partial [Chloroflexi bacterium]|nr:hypothetical protein [Chloroflexota bacterium]